VDAIWVEIFFSLKKKINTSAREKSRRKSRPSASEKTSNPTQQTVKFLSTRPRPRAFSATV
jgi:hypothetical protein